jgi:predicted LPLAT superfamily acyltransferase
MKNDPQSFRPCAIVPSYNHWRAARGVISRLAHAGLPVFLIDDGSDEPAKAELAKLHHSMEGVAAHRFNVNRGKGVAVVQGLRMAINRGFTHAVQVDADGQHDLNALPDLLALAKRHPDAVVTGKAVYDQTVPLGRAIGRWITHFWVWVETLSFRIPDTMCGFRVYPLDAVARLLAGGRSLGQRMDFDTEIAVRLFWCGTPIVPIPVKITYPPDNSSNFRLLKDNVRITAMHTRLVFAMLFNIRSVLAHRPRDIEGSQHWPWLAERGIYLGLLFLVAAYRCLGRSVCIAIMAPIVFYFYVTGREQRRASREFLKRAFAVKGGHPAPGFWDGYRHFLSFGTRALDTFIGWTKGMPADSLFLGETAALQEAEQSTKGAVFIVSHLGNIDLSRALLDEVTRKRLVLLVHTRHAENYNRIIRKFRPEAAVDSIQVSELGPESAIALQERIERGQWVVIAGDRTPVSGNAHTSSIPFLGEPAPFSHGPYILASLLGCPVYTLFCMREGRRYRLDIQKLADRVELPRQNRGSSLKAYATDFARVLEVYALEDPYQWYNFFDFWAGYDGAPEA